jgi:sensor histidine kinase regulating citrate/malate metabolism
MKAHILLTTAAIMLTMTTAQAEEAHVAPATEYIDTDVKPWINDKIVIDAIKAQNAANAGLSEAEILALDEKWRGEVEADSHPMIDGVMSNAVSEFLKAKQEASGGTITEVFVMDAKGLNVGQSSVTSDYWQGDEAKFQKSFGAGADVIFVDEAEKDESTQMLQAQASMTVVDETGKPIGAVTVGINLDKL